MFWRSTCEAGRSNLSYMYASDCQHQRLRLVWFSSLSLTNIWSSLHRVRMRKPRKSAASVGFHFFEVSEDHATWPPPAAPARMGMGAQTIYEIDVNLLAASAVLAVSLVEPTSNLEPSVHEMTTYFVSVCWPSLFTSFSSHLPRAKGSPLNHPFWLWWLF